MNKEITTSQDEGQDLLLTLLASKPDKHDHDYVAELFRLIEAPKKLRGIVPVLAFVDKILLPSIRKVKPTTLGEFEPLSKAPTLLKNILKLPTIARDQPHWFEPVQSLHGLCGKYPLYAIMCAYPGLIGMAEKRERFLAGLFISYWNFYENLSDGQRALVGRAYRAVFENSEGSIVDVLPNYAKNIDDLIEKIEACFIAGRIDVESTSGRYLHHLLLLFQGRLQASSGEKRSGRGGKGGDGSIRGEGGRSTLIETTGSIRDIDDTEDPVGYQTVNSSDISQAEQKESIARGINENEMLSTRELALELMDQTNERKPDVNLHLKLTQDLHLKLTRLSESIMTHCFFSLPVFASVDSLNR